jgi:hypothetical protein
MSTWKRHFVRAVLAIGSGVALVVPQAGTATAAGSVDSIADAWPNDTYDVTEIAEQGIAIGGIIWGNRTSTIQGYVQDYGGSFSTTVYFTAYAGATKIDGDTRTAGAGAKVSYNFGIGNPDLVGGFDRLKIQVCQSHASETCSDPVMLHRDGVGEFGFWRP